MPLFDRIIRSMSASFLGRREDPARHAPAKSPSPEDAVLPSEPVIVQSPDASRVPAVQNRPRGVSFSERLCTALIDSSAWFRPHRGDEICDDLALEVLSYRTALIHDLQESPFIAESERDDRATTPDRGVLFSPTILWLAAGLKALVLGPWSPGARTRNSVSQDDHAEKPAE